MNDQPTIKLFPRMDSEGDCQERLMHRRNWPVHGAWYTRLLVTWMVFASPRPAAAFSSTLEDTIADYLALFIMIVAPILLITVILAIHVIPEKVAYRRHHPQADAIKVLCFLSLVFGGLLWPLAWLWAYSKPVLYKIAYGEDKVIHAHGKGDENETKPQAVRE